LSLDKCLMVAVICSKKNACARAALTSSSICGVDFRSHARRRPSRRSLGILESR
jgi:hypothetical protein